MPNSATIELRVETADPPMSRSSQRPPPLPKAAATPHAPSGRVPWGAHFGHYLTRPLLRAGPILFGVGIVAIIAYAWLIRNEGHWTAESGIGYWLGIAGSVTMLLLILYPLRKRYRILHGLGRVASWFRIHMVLGILGPTLIILHSNFKIGSLNSRLALFTMLVVVASGIVGRYLYSQVHKGLYGSRAEARDILADAEALKRQLGIDLAGSTSIFSGLEEFNTRVSETPKSAMGGLWAALTIGGRVRRARRQMFRLTDKALSAHASENGWSRRQKQERLNIFREHMRIYFAAVKKAQKLALFERLFALWHVLHMPLFVLLVMTVVIHIVAVHLY